MFIYIKTNPRKEWNENLTFIKDILENENSLSPKEMLLSLSNIKAQGHISENIQRIFFETLTESDIDNFVFNKVDDLTSLEENGTDLTTQVKGLLEFHISDNDSILL